MGVHSNRGLQEVLSRFSCSPGVIMTGIRAGEPRGIDGSYGDYLPSRIKDRQGFLEQSREEEGGYPGHELVEGRIVGNLLQLEQVFDRIQQLDEVHRVPIVGTQSLP